jgi:branched-subunit amino acid transport protein AzlD
VLVVAPSDVARARDSRPGWGRRAQSPLAALEPAPQESESFRSQRIAAKPAAAAAVWACAWASMLVSALAYVAPEWTARWPPDRKWRAPPPRQLALSTLAMLTPTLALAPALVATALCRCSPFACLTRATLPPRRAVSAPAPVAVALCRCSPFARLTRARKPPAPASAARLDHLARAIPAREAGKRCRC